MDLGRRSVLIIAAAVLVSAVSCNLMSELSPAESQPTAVPTPTASGQNGEAEAGEVGAMDEATPTEPASASEGQREVDGSGAQLAVAAGDLLIVDVETGESETIASSEDHDLKFKEVYWSPRGDWIAAEAEIVQEGPQIRTGLFLVRPDGSELKQIAADELEQIGKLSWAPSGDRFAVEGSDPESGRGTYLVDPETGDLDPFPTDLSATEPAWSSDGAKLAVSALHVDGFQLYSLPIDVPGSFEKLTEEPGEAYQPDWSFNGASLVYEHAPEDGSGIRDIRVIGADGQGLVPLTENDLDERNPRWSPSADRIAFMREPVDARFSYELVLMDPDGSNELILSAELLTEDQRPAGQSMPVPEWSANGQQLALIGGDGAIYLLAADGSAVETLDVSMRSREATLSWAPPQ